MQTHLITLEMDRWLRTAELLAPVDSTSKGSAQAGVISGAGLRPNVFFLDPLNGNDGNDGRDPRKPLLTLQKAFDNCVHLRGDIIVRRRGAETVTAAVTVDKGGVTLIADTYGGNAERMESFYTQADASYTTGPVLIIRKNITIIGMTFVGRHTAGPSVSIRTDSGTSPAGAANYVHMKHCVFPSWGLGKDGVELQGANLCLIEDCTFDAAENSGAGIIFMGSGTNNPVRNHIRRCTFTNMTSGIEVRSGTPQDNIIEDCTFVDCTVPIDTTAGAGDGFIKGNWFEVANTAAYDDTVANLKTAGWTFAGNNYSE